MSNEIDDYSSIEQETPDGQFQLEGNVYSWGKTARLKIEPAYLEVYKALGGDLLAVDLCSSYPHLRQIMTGRYKQEMAGIANRALGAFVDDLNAPTRKNKIPLSVTLEANTLARLRAELAPKHGLPRKLLNTAIFDLFVNPPPARDRNAELIAKNLLEKFQTSDRVLEYVTEPDGKPGDKGNWTFIATARSGVTLEQALQPILGVTTPEFLRDIARYFGTHLETESALRRVAFVSLDIAPFDHIVTEAKKGFPPRMQNTLFFKSGQEAGRHVVADISHIPFADQSVSFFSSIEGWPYYGYGFGFEGNLAIAKRLSEALVAGGKAVFFPWNMENMSVNAINYLLAIEKVWKESGLTISMQGFIKDEILRTMTDRELVLSQHSPLLRQRGILTSLTLSKPLAK